jgi:hypothetical protein
MTMLIALAAIWIGVAVQQPAFLSPRNLSLLMIELSVTAILALGMLLVLLPGQIDLSAGSGVGLTGAVAAVMIYWSGVPAPIALLVAAIGAVLVWAAMGSLIVVQRVPAFIITLGGLLVFKGLHWLTIRNQTVPIVEGGGTNTYSLLTTYYLLPVAGYVLAAIVIIAMVAGTLRARARRRNYGLEADDRETTFLKLFALAQLLLLVLLVTNQYRGVPLAALILGGVALGIHCSHDAHPVRPLPVRDRWQRGGGAIIGCADPRERHRRIRDHGPGRGADGLHADRVFRGLDDHGWLADGARCHRGVRHRWRQLARWTGYRARGAVRLPDHGESCSTV